MGAGAFIKKLAWTAASVASAMPGPIGAVAQAVKAITGQDVGNDANKLITAINGATPEQMIEFQKFEAQHAETMQAAGFKAATDLIQIDADDRASARARQVALKDVFVPVLATVVIVAFAIICYVSLTGHIRANDVLAGTIIGYIAGCTQQVVAFYFGSSAGSEAKNELLARKGRDA